MNKDYFSWNLDFEVGNKLIDEQHYKFLELVHLIIDLDLKNNQDIVSNFLVISEHVDQYMEEHFIAEEELMEKYQINRTHTVPHKQAHKDFKDYIDHIRDDLSCLYNRKIMKETIEYLVNWLAYHVLHMDKTLFQQIRYIEENGLQPSEVYDKTENSINSNTEPLLQALKALYYFSADKNQELKEQVQKLEQIITTQKEELNTITIEKRKISVLDDLTGLYNRQFALTEIEQFMDNWRKYKIPFFIFFLSADKIQKVNDTYGHEKGDFVLKWIAKFLKDTLDKTNIICRINGDEFLIICTQCEKEETSSIEEILKIACSKETCSEIMQYWNPSFSIASAYVDESIQTTEGILKKATDSMYASKNAGGGQISIS